MRTKTAQERSFALVAGCLAPPVQSKPRCGFARFILATVLVTALGLQFEAALAEPFSFQGIGVFPSPNYADTLPNGISADGRWVVGRAQIGYGGGVHLFRWSRATGLEDLGSAEGNAVSIDGSVLVGRGTTSPYGAVRWTQATGIVDLGSLGWNGLTQAEDVSGDGSVIVGISAGNVGGNEAFRWTQNTGMVALPKLGGGNGIAWARAVSNDGLIAVGESESQAVLWTGNSQPLPLGFLPGSNWSSAAGVSASGSIFVVGNSGTEAFLWTPQAGMQGLGSLANSVYTNALDVSANGAVVVGRASGHHPFGEQAVIWDSTAGMRPLKEVLETQLDLTGWSLLQASAISDDGRTITGWGRNPAGVVEGWIATIPEPSTPALLLFGTAILGLALRHKRSS